LRGSWSEGCAGPQAQGDCRSNDAISLDCPGAAGGNVGDTDGAEAKAAAGEVAISVTSAAMRICGGAAFSKHLSIERLFRDAHAGAVMAPTGDVLREFIGKSLLGMPLF